MSGARSNGRRFRFIGNCVITALCNYGVASMPRTTRQPNETSFNLRVDPTLKAAFTAAAEAEDKPAAQILRDFMRLYVRRRERAAFAAEARRQSVLVAERAQDLKSDEYAVMRELEAELEDESFWKA
jgi:hypothetical protein